MELRVRLERDGHEWPLFHETRKAPQSIDLAKKQDTEKIINSFQATWKTMNISSNKEDPPGSSGGKVATKVRRQVLWENWILDGGERDT
jgi:hypothetical protein